MSDASWMIKAVEDAAMALARREVDNLPRMFCGLDEEKLRALIEFFATITGKPPSEVSALNIREAGRTIERMLQMVRNMDFK